MNLGKRGGVTRHESHIPSSACHLGRLRVMDLTASEPLINSDLLGLKLVSKGKVRDIYETGDPNRLLFVASDRISAYDVILKNVRVPYMPPGCWMNEQIVAFRASPERVES